MQEEDITNWRASMGGAQSETRQEVLEEEVEGELEGEYDPYDLGYSPTTPVAPSGLPGSRTGEGLRTSPIRSTSDHPLRFTGHTPSPPPWEIIGPPESSDMPRSNSFGVTQLQSRPLIPRSAYYFGPPPLDSAYHTDPIGQIGVHHPREIIRVERDYVGGELVQFASTYPLELEGRITPTQFLETINAINERLISAHSLKWSCFDNALSFFTLQLSRLFVSSHHDRQMRLLRKTIDEINTTLYNPVGLNILWPRNVAFMFLEIEYYVSNVLLLPSISLTWSAVICVNIASILSSSYHLFFIPLDSTD
ncbi:Golgin subfamily A member 7/ERF4 family-domain-containing protein [Irpex rosettiformis]|uniref:Golgin subfamily A member 7/ERF4 family-domain-containing protein n=1 Tax=Irpex rosettiformis TaxID=378272 RepID=A0ACB8U662_9APHY|nr:Golgin subfamily A member 7/ERF4 family-domain-containing protein [Irpex rosettiformis]